MPYAAAAFPWYVWFKTAVFMLLACNTAIFSFLGTFSETLDIAAWLVLLALFELETGYGHLFHEKRLVLVIHGIRLAAAAAIGAVAVSYVFHAVWLDAINSGLWIAVVVLLELEVRYPRAVEWRRAWFTAAAATLYSGLAALVLAWAWRGEWFEAYDALLWLIAFATIEINVLQIFRGKSPAPEPLIQNGETAIPIQR